jgi:hypothetical protein
VEAPKRIEKWSIVEAIKNTTLLIKLLDLPKDNCANTPIVIVCQYAPFVWFKGVF